MQPFVISCGNATSLEMEAKTLFIFNHALQSEQINLEVLPSPSGNSPDRGNVSVADKRVAVCGEQKVDCRKARRMRGNINSELIHGLRRAGASKSVRNIVALLACSLRIALCFFLSPRLFHPPQAAEPCRASLPTSRTN